MALYPLLRGEAVVALVLILTSPSPHLPLSPSFSPGFWFMLELHFPFLVPAARLIVFCYVSDNHYPIAYWFSLILDTNM